MNNNTEQVSEIKKALELYNTYVDENVAIEAISDRITKARLEEHFKYEWARELNMDMDEWNAHRISELQQSLTNKENR